MEYFGNVAIDEKSGSHNDVTEENCANQVKSEVDHVVVAVEERVQDGILSAIDKVMTPKIEMAVRSTTRLSGHGLSSLNQNHDLMDFSENMEKTPLMTAFSSTDLFINQGRKHETHNLENQENDEFWH